MNLFGAFFDLNGQTVTIVGGGMDSLHPAATLADHGARVVVVAPAILPAIAELEGIETRERPWQPADLDNALFVIAATDAGTNDAVARVAREHHLPCHLTTGSEPSTLHLGSLAQNGPFSVAVSSAGLCPALDERLKNELAGLIGDEYARLGSLLADIHQQLLSDDPSGRHAGRILGVLANSALLEAIRDNDRDSLRRTLQLILGYVPDLDDILPPED